MIIFSWNIRGLNNPLKQHEVVSLMKKHKMDVCGLLETKLLPSKVASFQKFRLRHWQHLSNANVANTARIVVLWNPSTVKVDLIASSAQAVHLTISCLISHISFKASFVYGFNTITARRSLWEDLRSWNSNSPWMVLGDFNSMLSSVDKHNGAAVSSYETSDFRDCCSDLGLHDANFTGCHFSWTNGSVWCKLDRVLINPAWFSLQHFTRVHFDPPGAFTDHSPATVRFAPFVQGRRNFKFFNMWAMHDQFLETVSSCWPSSVYGTPMYILCRKLKLLKGPLKELNRLHFSHISQRVSRMESKLEQLQVSFELDRDNQLLLEHDKLLRSKLSFLKFAENQFFSQKIKCKYLKESDRGTKFFHALMGQNHRRNFIPAIMCRNGNLSSSLKAVGDEFVAYYQQLLGTSKSTIPIDSDVISCGPCIPSSSHSLLLSPVSAEDIRQAVFSIDNDKAPGPDGYSSFFFKKAWPIVGGDFCSAIQDFFHSGRLLKQVNHSIITLIPKSKNVTFPSDFRPISCCNVIYKVLAKILADRLAQALQGIISPMQNAFLGGRYMSDNINLVQELLRQYGRKRSSPRCLLKVDFKKAFDSVQWGFLDSLLSQLGFPAAFVNLVMQCVSSASYSVAVNGDIHGFFAGQSGVRQGDPLSPYLFICCMEYFSRMLMLASQQEVFRFHPKCAIQGITHLAFADDVLILSRGDSSSVTCILNQLATFGHTSGLGLNPQKSFIFFGGVRSVQKQSILSSSGFKEGEFPFTYLGVPLSPHRLLASQFSPLLQDLQSSVQGWIGKHLSYAGRLELLRSVLFGKVQFWLNIFPIPAIVMRSIISICRNFLWTGDVNKGSSALVAWKTVCMPKEEGGLGLFDLCARNRSFLAKQLWHIHLKTDSVWIRWIHHFYLSNGTIWNVDAHHTSSPLWKAIISVRDHILHLCGDSEVECISQLNSWSTSTGSFLAHAYEFLRPVGSTVSWSRVVWEQWALPKYSFILWLAAMGKLRTRDRLPFIPNDPTCAFCRSEEESHGHLFFSCSWTVSLWNKIKSWLRIGRRMSTLTSAIRGLHSKWSNMEFRMKRVSLAITVYLIWEERNKRVFEANSRGVDTVFRRFQILFYTVLHFHEKLQPLS